MEATATKGSLDVGVACGGGQCMLPVQGNVCAMIHEAATVSQCTSDVCYQTIAAQYESGDADQARAYGACIFDSFDPSVCPGVLAACEEAGEGRCWMESAGVCLCFAVRSGVVAGEGYPEEIRVTCNHLETVFAN